MTDKEQLVKAIVHVRKSWVETTGGAEIFESASFPLGHAAILVLPVTDWNISDPYFVAITLYPRALRSLSVKSLKAFIPKNEIVLIVELKSPEGMSALGYKWEGEAA